jgi:hypothetical protein
MDTDKKNICENCKYIENLIREAYDTNQEYKDALNTIIQKNKIILEQNKIIDELKKQLSSNF